MPTVEVICEANVLAAAERHFNGPCGTCHTCAHAYTPSVSEDMPQEECDVLDDVFSLFDICLADPHDPCVVRKDEVHDDCWGAV